MGGRGKLLAQIIDEHGNPKSGQRFRLSEVEDAREWLKHTGGLVVDTRTGKVISIVLTLLGRERLEA